MLCPIVVVAVIVLSLPAWAKQKLSVHWEELTAPDFAQAISPSGGTCLLPFGIFEKDGPHLPLGTDLLDVRYATLHAAEQEYAIVFSEYYFGQIFEASHRPGTIAYSAPVQLELLQETTEEMARNGCKTVIIVNRHGGNEHLLPYFAQSQLHIAHDYVVYVLGLVETAPGGPQKKTSVDMHAGESETSTILITRPDLMHVDRAASQSGEDQARLHLPEKLYTAIWSYARFPNHYSGEGVAAAREVGQYKMDNWVKAIVGSIKAVKADQSSLKLQNEFFEQAKHPLDTKQ
jgi:creatinine amidohydrolase